jgi:hypothetical protein
MTPEAARYAVTGAALYAATAHIKHILGPRTHPDVKAVIQVVADALAAQRRATAAAIRREAAAFRRSEATAPGNQQLTYDGGLRRAARIAEGATP